MDNKEPLSDIKAKSAIDYMLRTTQQHHVQLSTLADQKANIIIAASSILLTISLSNLKFHNILWGLVSLIIFALLSLIFAMLAVAPLFQKKKLNLTEQEFNPLFYDHFTRLSLDEYYKTMDKVMSSDTNLYKAIIKDIYEIGLVLRHRKYKYLKYSYQTFLAGLLVSVLLFALQLGFQFFMKV